MLDQLSLFSDELTELLLAEEPVPAELIRQVLREATLHNMIVPVLCGSALDGIGVQPLLDARGRLPAQPGRRAAGRRHRSRRSKDAKIVRKPDADEPFCGLVFKIQADRHGDLHYVRVYSGELKANSRVYNPGKDKKENVPQLWQIQADRREQVDRAVGRRHRRRHRPAPLGHRRHALRHASTRSCWSRSPFPRRSSRWPSSRRPRPSARSWPTCWT